MILAERQNAIVNFLAERGFSNSVKSHLIVILETSKICVIPQRCRKMASKAYRRWRRAYRQAKYRYKDFYVIVWTIHLIFTGFYSLFNV